MSTVDALKRIEDLKLLYTTYKQLINDVSSTFYKSKYMTAECKKLQSQIQLLQECIYLGEMDDDYDAATGTYNGHARNRGDWL